MAPHLESNWEHYIQHVKFWRTEVKRSLGEMISNLEIVSSGNGKPTIFGLAAAPGDSSFNQILMHAEICLGFFNFLNFFKFSWSLENGEETLF